MGNRTNYYHTKISVGTSEQQFDLPPLRKFAIRNIGAADCQIELDNDITVDSLTVAQGEIYNFGGGKVFIKHQTASGSTELEIIGEKQWIDD